MRRSRGARIKRVLDEDDDEDSKTFYPSCTSTSVTLQPEASTSHDAATSPSQSARSLSYGPLSDETETLQPTNPQHFEPQSNSNSVPSTTPLLQASTNRDPQSLHSRATLFADSPGNLSNSSLYRNSSSSKEPFTEFVLFSDTEEAPVNLQDSPDEPPSFCASPSASELSASSRTKVTARSARATAKKTSAPRTKRVKRSQSKRTKDGAQNEEAKAWEQLFTCATEDPPIPGTDDPLNEGPISEQDTDEESIHSNVDTESNDGDTQPRINAWCDLLSQVVSQHKGHIGVQREKRKKTAKKRDVVSSKKRAKEATVPPSDTTSEITTSNIIEEKKTAPEAQTSEFLEENASHNMGSPTTDHTQHRTSDETPFSDSLFSPRKRHGNSDDDEDATDDDSDTVDFDSALAQINAAYHEEYLREKEKKLKNIEASHASRRKVMSEVKKYRYKNLLVTTLRYLCPQYPLWTERDSLADDDDSTSIPVTVSSTSGSKSSKKPLLLPVVAFPLRCQFDPVRPGRKLTPEAQQKAAVELRADWSHKSHAARKWCALEGLLRGPKTPATQQDRLRIAIESKWMATDMDAAQWLDKDTARRRLSEEFPQELEDLDNLVEPSNDDLHQVQTLLQRLHKFRRWADMRPKKTGKNSFLSKFVKTAATAVDSALDAEKKQNRGISSTCVINSLQPNSSTSCSTFPSQQDNSSEVKEPLTFPCPEKQANIEAYGPTIATQLTEITTGAPAVSALVEIPTTDTADVQTGRPHTTTEKHSAVNSGTKPPDYCTTYNDDQSTLPLITTPTTGANNGSLDSTQDKGQSVNRSYKSCTKPIQKTMTSFFSIKKSSADGAPSQNGAPGAAWALESDESGPSHGADLRHQQDLGGASTKWKALADMSYKDTTAPSSSSVSFTAGPITEIARNPHEDVSMMPPPQKNSVNTTSIKDQPLDVNDENKPRQIFPKVTVSNSDDGVRARQESPRKNSASTDLFVEADVNAALERSFASTEQPQTTTTETADFLAGDDCFKGGSPRETRISTDSSMATHLLRSERQACDKPVNTYLQKVRRDASQKVKLRYVDQLAQEGESESDSDENTKKKHRQKKNKDEAEHEEEEEDDDNASEGAAFLEDLVANVEELPTEHEQGVRDLLNHQLEMDAEKRYKRFFTMEGVKQVREERAGRETEGFINLTRRQLERRAEAEHEDKREMEEEIALEALVEELRWKQRSNSFGQSTYSDSDAASDFSNDSQPSQGSQDAPLFTLQHHNADFSSIQARRTRKKATVNSNSAADIHLATSPSRGLSNFKSSSSSAEAHPAFNFAAPTVDPFLAAVFSTSSTTNNSITQPSTEQPSRLNDTLPSFFRLYKSSHSSQDVAATHVTSMARVLCVESRQKPIGYKNSFGPQQRAKGRSQGFKERLYESNSSTIGIKRAAPQT